MAREKKVRDWFTIKSGDWFDGNCWSMGRPPIRAKEATVQHLMVLKKDLLGSFWVPKLIFKSANTEERGLIVVGNAADGKCVKVKIGSAQKPVVFVAEKDVPFLSIGSNAVVSITTKSCVECSKEDCGCTRVLPNGVKITAVDTNTYTLVIDTRKKVRKPRVKKVKASEEVPPTTTPAPEPTTE